MSPGTMQQVESEFPVQPPPRNYELREGRLHKFPQRRNMVVDHIGGSFLVLYFNFSSDFRSLHRCDNISRGSCQSVGF